jgi:hypothetical protein
LQHQPPKPPSKRPVIIEGIIGTVAIFGIDTIIGARITAIITGITIGDRITATTITGIGIIGN